MCSICGCGQPAAPGVTIEGAGEGTGHDHHHQGEPHGQRHAHERGADTRLIRLEEDLLAENDRHAARNRAWLRARGVLALNLVSSPGSGKTTLLARTAAALKDRLPVAVIEGDQQTSRDAERIRAAGVPAVQINTGKACHLDAHMVGHALERLDPLDGGLLFVENVGNLVCPAAFDLGEAHKVVVVSVTEGEDKPLKYGSMFAAADLMLLNKTDLLPYVEFDLGRCIAYAHRVNSHLETLALSATTGEGMAAWLDWLERERAVLAARPVLEAGE